MDGIQYSTSQPAFPLARYKYYGINYYYACGNTQAEDFLQCCAGVKKPSILSLGNGDIRSCFYTLWKNFDFSISNAPQQFGGVDFLLNDLNSAVLARNIIMIHLCLGLPDGADERKKWLCAMWAVWYCHELYPQHQAVLDDSLKLLLKYSESPEVWECPDNPLHSLVCFTSPAVLADVSELWKAWLEKLGGSVSVDRMQSSRQKFYKRLEKRTGDFNEFSSSLLSDNISVIGDESELAVQSRIPEMVSYLESGSLYAENVFQTDVVAAPTTVNFTLYDNQKGRYTLFPTPPFNSFYHTVEFSPKAMKRAGVEEGTCATLLVPSASFKSHPLLANSVQQFSMWVQSASTVLKERRDAISFTFNNRDALAFCQELQHGTAKGGNQFDAIFSSNLMDHLGLANVVLSAMPLLTPEGLLFMASMLYKYTTMTCFEKLLSLCFGFDCKLLPVILGVRCINHEGAGYASPIMIQPCPERSRPQRLLIWQKVSGMPMCISKLPPAAPGNVTEGLACSFLPITSLMSSCKLENVDEQCLVSSYSIETAMLVLQTFLSSINAGSDYRFCEPLCRALTTEFRHIFKSFFWGLQTQALLHGLHIHLTVDEATCPVCRHVPIEEYLGLFCAEIPLRRDLVSAQRQFLAIIDPDSSLEMKEGQNLGLPDKDVHVIDCFDGCVCESKLLLKFFAPKNFATKNSKVTVAYSSKKGECSEMTFLSQADMQSMQVEFVPYNFASMQCSSSVRQDVAGEWVSISYTQQLVTADVTLSNSMLEGLTETKLKTSKISSCEMQLTCGLSDMNLEFLYPVDYGGTRIKLCKAAGRVRIICPRQIHNFEDEKSIFIACPDHQLSLPSKDVAEKILNCHAGMQMVSGFELQGVSEGVHAFKMEMNGGSMLEAKLALSRFFLEHGGVCFHLTSREKEVCGQVLVNKRMFDYQNYAPAVDLAFCFPESHSHPTCTQHLQTVDISISDAAFNELKKILVYFAKRTNGDCKSAGVNSAYHDLVEEGVDMHFARAVVYFLYCDPEMMTGGMGTFGPIEYNKCYFCHKMGELKTCKQCGKARYCGRDCQVKHWPKHKVECKKCKKQ